MCNNIIKYKEAKRLTHEDFGVTEDEFNNFLIDCFELMKILDSPVKQGTIISPISGKSVTFTITKQDHYGNMQG